MTGNPVRPDSPPSRDAPYAAPQRGGPVRLLVIGGSQGARIFSEVGAGGARAAAAGAARAASASRSRPRPRISKRRASAYRRRRHRRPSCKPSSTDVPERLASAHLVICRSGASTVAELAAAGRPAILVPYPYATDDHQTANARALSRCRRRAG